MIMWYWAVIIGLGCGALWVSLWQRFGRRVIIEEIVMHDGEYVPIVRAVRR